MDMDALVAHLADDRYDAAIRRGSNNALIALVNEIEPGEFHWVDIDPDDFMDIISGETLTAEQHGMINNYLAGKEMVATSRAPVRQWLQDNVSVEAITALTTLARVPSSYCKRAGVDCMGLPEARLAVRRIAKSYIVTSGQAVLEV